MSRSSLVVRPAGDDDLDAIAEMVQDFVRGHPAEHRPPVRECHLSGAAFERFADLAGQPVRTLVRNLLRSGE